MWGGGWGRLARPHRTPVTAAPGAPVEAAHESSALADAVHDAERRALVWSDRPGAALLLWLGAGFALAAIGMPLGVAITGDQALVFRELMPGTWLSFAELLAISAAASATHRVVAPGGRWHETFWGVAAVVFAALAFVEIAQPTVFVAHWLRDHVHVATPAGLADLDAAILIGLLLTVGVGLLVRARPLLALPRVLGLFAVGAALGAASETLDATFAATRWEFVAEESLKLACWPFLLAGMLLALRTLRERTGARPPG